MWRSEAAQLASNRYKAKLSLLLLLYLLSPIPPFDPNPSLPLASSSQETPASISSDIENPEPGSTTHLASTGASVEILWTPPYQGQESEQSVRKLRELKTVKGATSNPTAATFDWSQTPPLSDAPEAERTAYLKRGQGRGVPEDNLAEGLERDVAPDSSTSTVSLPLSSPDRAPRNTPPALTPLTYTLLLFHLLFFVQFVLDASKSSISQSLLSNPLPPPFKPPPSTCSAATGHLSLSKRIGRLRWRVKLVSNRCGPALPLQVVALLFVLGVLGRSLLDIASGSSAPGWNGVVERGLIRRFELHEYTNFRVRNSARWLRPYRDVALIELLTTLTIGFDSLSPLLISLSTVPTSIRAPRHLLSKQASDLLVPTPYLFRLYRSVIYASFSLLQTLVLFVTRPKSTYRLLSFSTVLLVWLICNVFGTLLTAREKLETDFDKVSFLIQQFSKRRIRLDRGIIDGRQQEREQELLQELERESCCVCFEEEWEEEEKGERGFRSRCFLTRCGHQVHAGCLAKWFTRQSFCPACHKKVPVLPRFPVYTLQP